jgi:hypothetical protein
MAKKMSKGGKQFLSLIFHLAVLLLMVSLYDTARAMLKKDAPKSSTSETTSKKTTPAPAKKPVANKADENLATKPISRSTGTGAQINNKLTETKGKIEERGTSMADLMEQKRKKELEKKAAEEKAEKKSD